MTTTVTGAEPGVAGTPVVSILGVPVSRLSLEATAARIVEWAKAPRRAGGAVYVCATSVHGVMEAWRDPGFRQIFHEAGILTADGMPLVFIGRMRGHRQMERVYGPALMLRVCEATIGTGVRHYFYGGAEGVAEHLAQSLSVRFPGLAVAGSYCPPFRSLRDEEEAEIAARISDSGADIVWVGLSTPKQETWAAQMRVRLQAKVVVTVGAAFDFHTGRVKQAPAVLQKSGLEWLYRLSQEPARLWRRYLRNNPLFLILAGLELVGIHGTRRSAATRAPETMGRP